jgi:hypothetical protein
MSGFLYLTDEDDRLMNILMHLTKALAEPKQDTSLFMLKVHCRFVARLSIIWD